MHCVYCVRPGNNGYTIHARSDISCLALGAPFIRKLTSVGQIRGGVAHDPRRTGEYRKVEYDTANDEGETTVSDKETVARSSSH